MSEYRLDRTAFKAQSFAEADDHYSYWKDRSPEERLRAAAYLIRSAWGIESEEQFRMERRLTSMGRMDDRERQRSKENGNSNPPPTNPSSA